MADFCIQCGAPLNGNKFCTKCGTPAFDDDFIQASTPTQVMPPVENVAPAAAPASPSAPAIPVATVPAQTAAPAVAPAPKKGMATGVKIGIVAAAVVLGVGLGVGLAVLQPWAQKNNDGTAASAVSGVDVAGGGQSSVAGSDPDNNTVSVAPVSEKDAATGESSQEDSAALSSAAESSTSSVKEDGGATEVNVNVNISNSDEKTQAHVSSASTYILPESDTRRYSRSELEGMDSDSLSRAQNEIWARHGRLFKNQWLQSYFNEQSWYKGTIPADSFNSQYKSTSIEDDNASLISAILSERGWDVNKAHPN